MSRVPSPSSTSPPKSTGFPDKTTGAYLLWTDASGRQNTLVFDCVTSEDWNEPTEITEHPVEQGPNVADNIRVGLITCELQVRATNEPIDDNQWQALIQVSQQVAPPSPSWFVAPSGAFIVPVWESFSDIKALAGFAAGSVLGPAGTIGAAAAGSIVGGAAIPTVVPNQVGGFGGTPVPPTTVQLREDQTPDDFVGKTLGLLQSLKNAPQLVTLVGTKQVQTSMAIENIAHHRGADTGTGSTFRLTFKQIRLVTTVTVPTPAPTVIRATPPVSKGHQSTTPVDAKVASIWWHSLSPAQQANFIKDGLSDPAIGGS